MQGGLSALRMLSRYDQDSFFDLSPLGQLGLAGLSLCLFVGLVLMTRRGLARWPVWLRLFGALFVLWAFVWLSPQVYYMYYRLIIEDLPLQWVLKPPPGLVDMYEILTFQWRSNLSAHGKGVLGWSLLLAVAVPARRQFERPTPDP